ncbi:site-specific DNA-methyltransferase [Methylicorpusculum oleiharenae]|uniref:site-specific DNA-methyltransferase n=1 Tax=Methylicorpusculum oleiharenae TaxID=1338687 RepID=UPI001359C45D|nr:site-specific DNA-methyltransferase [Methylicorpusculum oleiharenae]MCD2450529.1 site-specific DNA-methyltransferase [Methylicorpusculum oleiharenae]
MAKDTSKLSVETLTHDDATRKNIPTAEYQSVMAKDEQNPIRLAYERRNRDLDPQLVWRGKDEQDWSDLIVHAPPLYIQEKVHPKVLIDDLLKHPSPSGRGAGGEGEQIDLFNDFNGLPDTNAKTEFYRHDAHWTNRMILGDSLQVMASLAEREGLRGKVQCIYFDPPYGIKFNSNFQWSTTSRDVKDGNTDHITREPEQVKAFRDTWRDGIHSYLTYLRDRLTVARDLLTDSGSIFVQIGDENVHLARSLLEEIFGKSNFISQITIAKTAGATSELLPGISDYIIWFAKNLELVKYRQAFQDKTGPESGAGEYKYVLEFDGTMRPLTRDEKGGKPLPANAHLYRPSATTSQRPPGSAPFVYRGVVFKPGPAQFWKTSISGLTRLGLAGRLIPRKASISYMRMLNDFPVMPINNLWLDTRWGFDAQDKRYVVETNTKILSRCIGMASDPGDLVLDPTCGSGTTAYVAEQWGRRWITIDTSRVALALARARIMGARYPYYLLADSPEGQRKEAEITRSMPSSQRTSGNIRHGFVYERVPHITLKAIANNAEIDVIWDKFQEKLEPLREQLNTILVGWAEARSPSIAIDASNVGLRSRSAQPASFKPFEEWEIPREADANWPDTAKQIHAEWWKYRIARQQEIDASIAAKADSEYLYDKPYEDKKKVRVAGPFTVESLSPHRVLTVDENDDLIDGVAQSNAEYREERDFVQMILENLKTAGVQQAHKTDKIDFTSLSPWPGELICADGRYMTPSPLEGEGWGEGEIEKRAAIFIGPEFGTVSRPDLVAAAREAGDAGFDVLIACAFNYDAHSSEFDKLGRIPVLKARMNADLHMADDLKNTGKGNLFVIFGEPDIDILDAKDDKIQVKVNGVDVFHPNTGEVRSDGAEGIACWFIDTDYNEESFFVRHAYFLGANDPYKALKTTLKAEINEEAWATLNSDTSRPFDKPRSRRIAVKVINHLGDEVMKVFRVC